MIIEEVIPAIVELLRNAARTRETVSYAELFSVFEPDTDKGDVYFTLEEASKRVCSRSEAIIDALLAGPSGLPGSGFFDIYRNVRPDEYRKSVGLTIIQDLSKNQKQQIIENERERVYDFFARP